MACTSRIRLLRLGVELQPDVAQVGRERVRAAALAARASCAASAMQRLDFRLRVERLDLHRAPRLHDLLVGRRLRQADVGGDVVVRGVDRGQRRLDLRAAGRCR